MFPQHTPSEGTCFSNVTIFIGQNMTQEVKYLNVCVTRYPSWSPATPARPSSAAGGGSQAAVPWPGHETPRRGSHRAYSLPLVLGTTLYFPLTRDWRPGGRGGEKTTTIHTVTEVVYRLSLDLQPHPVGKTVRKRLDN